MLQKAEEGRQKIGLIVECDTPKHIRGYFLFGLFSRYNGCMMSNYLNDKEIRGGCCGRPMVYAPENKCNFNNCCLSETCGCSVGRIVKDADPCKSCCVIPSITVDTTDGLTNLANCLVHVTSINTTFYIDSQHRPMIIWAGDVEVNLPDSVVTDEQWGEFLHSFNLNGQFLYVKTHDADNNKDIIISFYFDKTGKIYWAGEFEEITEA